MSSKRKTRDSLGRFTPGTEDVGTTLLEIPKYHFWRSIKTIVFFCIVVIVSLPWSVIFFEPAKTYSSHLVDYVGNLTSVIKDSACSCRSQTCRSSL